MANPNKSERIKLFEYYLKNKPKKKNLDLENAAGLSMGMNGSHIEAIVNESALLCVRENKKEISPQIIQRAFLKVASGVLASKIILSEEELQRVAIHEAAHGVCHIKLKGTLPRHMSIEQGAKFLGCVISQEKEQTLFTREDMFNRICLLLSGKVGEEMEKGDFSTGAKDDVKKASAIAEEMVCECCMGEYDNIALSEKEKTGEMCYEVFKQKKALLERAYEVDKKLLEENKDMLFYLKTALLEKTTLCQEEIEKLLKKECYI